MQNTLEQLPTVLLLGALVAIFFSLRRRDRSPRVVYWLIGWDLIFLHFFVSLLYLGTAPHLRRFIEIGTLPLAGIAFLVSVSASIHRTRGLRRLAILAAIPASAYSALLAWQVQARWPYLASFFVLAAGGAGWTLLRPQERRWWRMPPLAVLIFAGWVASRILQGNFETGWLGMLLIMYGMTAVLFARRYSKATPGVITTCAGFGAWASVWGLGIFAPDFVQRIGSSNELWNVPKFFVAFGMILVLLEEQSQAAYVAGERERAAHRQLQRFADITSRLLSGVEVKSFCGQIAQAITEATTFMRIAIVLVDEQGKLFVAGSSGVSEADLAEVREKAAQLPRSELETMLSRGQLIGKTALLLEEEQARPYRVRTTREYPPNPQWQAGNELYVPLRSPQGELVGLISLDDPADPALVTAEEMSKIEMLAADLAVAIDNAALQRKLVLTEKLASLGQLVSGVAHEMNNPLTAVMGYAELLGDRSQDPEMRRGLAAILREAQRMKDIVANLLRFAQQEPGERKTLPLLPLLREALDLRAGEARSRGIEMVIQLAEDLPQVAVDESQFKQVIFNVLTNAFDAVERAPGKRVTVTARTENARVVLTFADTGPGFPDVTRVFDPFFTTKAPGKGTGLGLSICYGVLKRHGGEITARNLHPTGACIAMELPAAQGKAAKAN